MACSFNPWMNYSALKIGRYIIVKRIAVGGMAELFHAKVRGLTGSERHVAIKRILPLYAANPEFRKMFEYEARMSRSLVHPNIVQTKDFTELGSTYILEMEFIHGVNLKQLINRLQEMGERLTVQWVAYFLKEVCAGLEYAHTRKDEKTGTPLHIIHRDMSPQNIMIAYDGSVKIVDFGIAKARNEADHTQTGVIKGKFAYMSPEQANGEEVDERTDIFSVGINLWELLTGQRLFARDNDLATLREVKQGVIPKPSALNPDVPEALDTIVLKALERDRNQRYQTAGELHHELRRFLAEYSPAFAPAHLGPHLQRLFNRDATIPETTRVSSIAILPHHVEKEYSGDVFYEASESSITCFHKPEENPIENSFTEMARPKPLPVVTLPPPKEKNQGLLSFVSITLGVIGIIAAVYFLQDFKPLEKPVTQASFSSRIPAAMKEPEMSPLKVMVNRDVDLYILGKKVAEAKAFTPVTLQLKGDRNHRVEFRNTAKGIRLSRLVLVKSGFINRLDVNIE